MAMTLDIFLQSIINDGIFVVEKTYTNPEDDFKRRGALAGYRACWGLNPRELAELLVAANHATKTINQDEDANDYWWHRSYEVEVEWVCNCVSVALIAAGHSPIIPPTDKAAKKAQEILKANGT